MITRKVNVYPKILIRPFCLMSRSLSFLSCHVTGRSSNSDYDTNHLLDKTKFQLNLSKKEIFIMILKKIRLVTHHSSWWKRKKYRKESYEILRAYKLKGWKLKKIIKDRESAKTIDTREFKIFLISK